MPQPTARNHRAVATRTRPALHNSMQMHESRIAVSFLPFASYDHSNKLTKSASYELRHAMILLRIVVICNNLPGTIARASDPPTHRDYTCRRSKLDSVTHSHITNSDGSMCAFPLTRTRLHAIMITASTITASQFPGQSPGRQAPIQAFSERPRRLLKPEYAHP